MIPSRHTMPTVVLHTKHNHRWINIWTFGFGVRLIFSERGRKERYLLTKKWSLEIGWSKSDLPRCLDGLLGVLDLEDAPFRAQ